MQRSIQVAGLAGMGKSALLRFLVSHPQLLTNNADFGADTAYCLYVDCNKLNPANALNFYRECNSRVRETQEPLPATDEYLLYKQLELALSRLPAQTFVILVIDRAHYLSEQAKPELFSQLRNLRDEARGGQMAFVFGGQRPLTEIPNLETLFSDICWVGPLSPADRDNFFDRHEDRLRLKLGEEWRNRLWEASGGHPAFLKNGLEWLKRQEPAQVPEDEVDFIRGLLSYAPIQRHCQGLWTGLTQAEQTFLADLERGHTLGAPPQPLQDGGLLVEQEGKLRLFSPLWAAYLREIVWPQEVVEPLQIELDSATRRVVLGWRGKQEEVTIRRRLVFDLLQVLAEEPGEVQRKDDLIQALYPGEKAYDTFDDALFQVVAALRRFIDDPVKRLCPDMSESIVQNVWGVGYCLVIDLPLSPSGGD